MTSVRRTIFRSLQERNSFVDRMLVGILHVYMAPMLATTGKINTAYLTLEENQFYSSSLVEKLGHDVNVHTLCRLFGM